MGVGETPSKGLTQGAQSNSPASTFRRIARKRSRIDSSLVNIPPLWRSACLKNKQQRTQSVVGFRNARSAQDSDPTITS